MDLWAGSLMKGRLAEFPPLSLDIGSCFIHLCHAKECGVESKGFLDRISGKVFNRGLLITEPC